MSGPDLMRRSMLNKLNRVRSWYNAQTSTAEYREPFVSDLRSLGIIANLAERGRPEEKIGAPNRVLWFEIESGWVSSRGEPLGLIDTPDVGPITWVRVFRHDEEVLTADYGVADSNVSQFPEVRIESVRVKRIPLVGRIINSYWRGNDFGLGIIDRLNNLLSGHDIRIRSYPDYGCWIISPSTSSA